MSNGFPKPVDRQHKVIIDKLKRAATILKDVQDTIDIGPDTEIQEMLDVAIEYVDGIPFILKAREKENTN